MTRSIWITLKLFRFELAVIIVTSFVLSLAAVAIGLQLTGLRPSPGCVDLTSGGAILGGDATRCPSLAAFSSLNGLAGPLLAIIGVQPFLAGALIGSQLVSGEIDHRTAQLAWSLAPVRWRWLADRILPPIGVLALALAVTAAASAYLEAARTPALQISSSFNDYGLWGPLLIFRGLTALALGVLIGAVAGRILPALLVTTALGGALFLGLPFISTLAQPLVPIAASQIPGNEYPLYVVSGWRSPDGRILTEDEALALVPSDSSGPGQAEGWLAARFESVDLGVPGAHMPAVEAREALLLSVMAVIAVSATALVIDRRRPS
jgi:ABC-type transport system involved in multi-copper enzyme maturation permease subunit